MNRDLAMQWNLERLEKRMTDQDVLNEVLVSKLDELTASHNHLVKACQAMLQQLNELNLRMAKMEARTPAQAPDLGVEGM